MQGNGRVDYDSNGVLNDDRARNKIIADYRRTTDAVAKATAKFRSDANQSYASAIGAVKGNRERTKQLETSTTVVQRNTEAVSRSTAKYNAVHRADQWQSSRDEQDHSQQRRNAGENINHTAFSLISSSQSATELARNFRDIEANIIKMME